MENKCFHLTQEQKACRHHSHFGIDMFSRNPKLIPCKQCGAPLYYDFATAQGRTLNMLWPVLFLMVVTPVAFVLVPPVGLIAIEIALLLFYLGYCAYGFIRAAKKPIPVTWQGTTRGVVDLSVAGVVLYPNEEAMQSNNLKDAIWLRYFFSRSRLPNSPKMDGNGRQNLMRLRNLWFRGYMLMRTMTSAAHSVAGKQVVVTGYATDALHGFNDKYSMEFVYVQACYLEHAKVNLDYSTPMYDLTKLYPTKYNRAS
ncbi:hypothetical protein LJC55_01980 [Eubacteriales bacterium OttesenSCG-928-N14]|nr:hypothetical protein [Eubacteriales bacterium OttesenSCG-928-N14]